LLAERGLPSRVVLNVDEGTNPGEIEVRLEGADDQIVLASRSLPRKGSCGELSEAVAVVAASWAGHYETPAPADSGAWDAAGAPAVARRATTVPPRESWSVGVSGGLVGAAEGGLSPQGALELTARFGGTRWFGRVGVSGSGDRVSAVGDGQAAWWRIIAMPSVGGTWGNSLFLEASLGPAVGPVFVAGRGFSPNAQDVSLDVGAASSLRLGYRFGLSQSATVWVGPSAISWLRPHRVSVDSLASDASIPRFDFMIGGGATFFPWR